MYELLYSEEALTELEKLEKNISERIIKTLERIRIRPQHFVEKLVASNLYKLRVGEYRVILSINNNKLIILVITLGHRKNIYDKL